MASWMRFRRVELCRVARVAVRASIPVMAAAGTARVALAEPVESGMVAGTEMQKDLLDVAQQLHPSGLSVKEVKLGDGRMAAQGMWVTVHYCVKLVGDGTVLDDTRKSGFGDRDYGQPSQFELGDLGDAAVLRALHAAVLDMRVGGRRRVRCSLTQPYFGFDEVCTCTCPTCSLPCKCSRAAVGPFSF